MHISNILTHGFLSKCKKGFNFATEQSKLTKEMIKTLSWNYKCIEKEITQTYCCANKSDSDVVLCLQLLCKTLHLS